MDKLVIYVTSQTHSLGLKSGVVLGLPVYCIQVHTRDNYSLRGQDLREAIERDRAQGNHPFIISETYPLCHIYKALGLRFSWYRRNHIKWRN